jgi:carbonic anhydrase
MRPLIDGVRQFQSHVMPPLREHFQELAGGQAPHTLFITCSDSRIDPSLITQTRAGELFVLRNAGNLVPLPGEDGGSASAVEYAVGALGVQQIVVCAHSGCGAMGGLLAPEGLEALPSVAEWVEYAEPTRGAVAHLPEGERLMGAIRHNAIFQLGNLAAHPSVARALAAETLSLHAWVYHIGSGEVEVLQTRGGVS